MTSTPQPSPDSNEVGKLPRLKVKRDPSFSADRVNPKRGEQPENADPNDVRNLMRMNLERDPVLGAKGATRRAERKEQGAAPDTNSVYAHLRTNAEKEVPRDYHDEARQIAQWTRQRLFSVLKVAFGLALVNLACLGVARLFNWEPRVAVPVLALGALVTVGTVWVRFAVNGR